LLRRGSRVFIKTFLKDHGTPPKTRPTPKEPLQGWGWFRQSFPVCYGPASGGTCIQTPLPSPTLPPHAFSRPCDQREAGQDPSGDPRLPSEGPGDVSGILAKMLGQQEMP
jgi:hypothetical protein